MLGEVPEGLGQVLALGAKVFQASSNLGKRRVHALPGLGFPTKFTQYVRTGAIVVVKLAGSGQSECLQRLRVNQPLALLLQLHELTGHESSSVDLITLKPEQGELSLPLLTTGIKL